MKNYNVIKMSNIAKQLTDRTFTDYFYRLSLLAQSAFDWDGLPNGIDEKWIERFLFTDGKCMFFKDKKKGFMVAKCNPAGNLNYYDEPTLLRPYGTNYMGDVFENYEECVVIRNNDLMIPTAPTVELYATRLTELQRTIDINVHAQKTPILITCDEKQKLTLKNVYNQWNGYEPVIFGEKSLDTSGVNVLKTDAPYVVENLNTYKHSLWNECMTFLGINNANQDKKERLVSAEVSANDSQVEMCARVMLKCRERACQLINEMFGLNVTVKLRCRLYVNTELDDTDYNGGDSYDG